MICEIISGWSCIRPSIVRSPCWRLVMVTFGTYGRQSRPARQAGSGGQDDLALLLGKVLVRQPDDRGAAHAALGADELLDARGDLGAEALAVEQAVMADARLLPVLAAMVGEAVGDGVGRPGLAEARDV